VTTEEDVIRLDLSAVPDVATGLAEARTRRTQLEAPLRGSFRNRQAISGHVALMSFTNRAMSLQAGVASAIAKENPHAAFTLLRAYLELVATVNFVNASPDYIEVLKKPMRELPRGSRKRFVDLFAFASDRFPDIEHYYAVLNEMAHFGSTALWQPFNYDNPELVAYQTSPHWKASDEPRLALALLARLDAWTTEVFYEFVNRHLPPHSAGDETGSPNH
jgi:hypothetical protein